jgi:hypothetical protein
MPLATLPQTLSLDSVWEELVFTEVRLSEDEHATEHVPPFKVLLTNVATVREGQLAVWHEEVSAQAAVSAANDRLDDLVRKLARTLWHMGDDLKSDRYLRYFPSTPTSIARLGLENELPRVRGWTESLTSEPEKDLQDLGATLRQLVDRSDQVLERRRKAEGARRDHRVRSINGLISEINNIRLSVYGSLTKKAAELRLGRDWPDRFFRHNVRPSRNEAEPGPPAPPPPEPSPSTK